MPKGYTKIKRALMRDGMNEKEAEAEAAKQYIGSKKTPAERSRAAKALAKHRKPKAKAKK